MTQWQVEVKENKKPRRFCATSPTVTALHHEQCVPMYNT